MIPRRYGPLPYVPITRRPKLTWPDGVRVALSVNPNIEFFGLDRACRPNDRGPREHAKIPNCAIGRAKRCGCHLRRLGAWRYGSGPFY